MSLSVAVSDAAAELLLADDGCCSVLSANADAHKHYRRSK